MAFRTWKLEGRPADHPARTAMKTAKRMLRSAQRQLNAVARLERLEAIMDAAETDQRLLYKLIAKESKNSNSMPDVMEFNGVRVPKDQQGVAFANYFGHLATPKDEPHYRQDYKEYVNLKYDLICTRNIKETEKHIPEMTPSNVSDIIATMKNNKAADIRGIAAEHLKLAHPDAHKVIAILLNRILEEGRLPAQLKHGLITPVYKQKKSAKNPDNYRRITVVPMLGKLIEKIIIKPTKPILAKRLSKLQRGFCDNSSSINTALLLSEAISEAQDTNVPLFVAYLDATKAFDVVWHKSMLCTIHSLGITGDLWKVYNDMYKQLTSQVKCNGVLSPVLEETQGVRQGGIPSTELFKARGDGLLQTLSRSRLGFEVGTIDVSAPTCADDISLIGRDPVALQAMLNLAIHDAHRERYEFSATKSKVMVINSKTKSPLWESLSLWEIDGRKLEVSDQETHLGIQRLNNGKATKSVEHNIQKARRASYALVGVGMHGVNGLHVRVNLHLWNCYVMPRLTYGLEVLALTETNINDLDAYQRQTFRRLLHLPPGT